MKLLASILSLALLAALTGCWETRGPALPDLSSQRSEAGREAQRLQRIRQVMGEDVERFDGLREEFGDEPAQLYARPFPLDLYKQVAMECLNEPWDPNEDVVSDEESLHESLGLKCSPQFLGTLLDELSTQGSARRDEALARLRTVDEMRRLRGKLRHRLARIQPILQGSRSLLATRRAELRQARLSYRRRRTEYSASRWQQLQERLDAYRDELDQLEQRIIQLEDAWPSWPDELESSVSSLYMEISQLPRPSDKD